MVFKIPKSHPRAESLKTREKLIEGHNKGCVATAGLIAQGRGEAFDYILGEKTNDFALSSIKASAAALLLAENPVISVNGNVAILVPEEIAKLSKLINAKIEINLFYRTNKREKVIEKVLKNHGAGEVLGIGREASCYLKGIDHLRGRVSPKGIYNADIVFVPLEDGDRTKALRDMGKKVIVVDLSPFSRSAKTATIAIVDNITRAMPALIKEIKIMKKLDKKKLEMIHSKYNNKKALSDSFKFMKNRLGEMAKVEKYE
ncbi:MAG: phosphopantothenate/pantothenate synthetase [Candidatus Aenigmarchaeota archaeon]|nr:phosphopantothenate/pantothenate synthetase [Candidatus Aenigmarchaeota archaeon]